MSTTYHLRRNESGDYFDRFPKCGSPQIGSLQIGSPQVEALVWMFLLPFGNSVSALPNDFDMFLVGHGGTFVHNL